MAAQAPRVRDRGATRGFDGATTVFVGRFATKQKGTAMTKSGPSAKRPFSSKKVAPSTPPVERSRRTLRVRRPLLFGLIFGIVAGGLVVMWPFFVSAESAVELALVLAVLLLSIGLPLLLLRSILRRRPPRPDREDLL